jgi:hypothetical protein
MLNEWSETAIDLIASYLDRQEPGHIMYFCEIEEKDQSKLLAEIIRKDGYETFIDMTINANEKQNIIAEGICLWLEDKNEQKQVMFLPFFEKTFIEKNEDWLDRLTEDLCETYHARNGYSSENEELLIDNRMRARDMNSTLTTIE